MLPFVAAEASPLISLHPKRAVNVAFRPVRCLTSRGAVSPCTTATDHHKSCVFSLSAAIANGSYLRRIAQMKYPHLCGMNLALPLHWALTDTMRTNRPDALATVSKEHFSQLRQFLCCYAACVAKRQFKATISLDFRPSFRCVMFEFTNRRTMPNALSTKWTIVISREKVVTFGLIMTIVHQDLTIGVASMPKHICNLVGTTYFERFCV